MKYIYGHNFLISVHEVIGICGIYVGFEEQICCWHIYGYNMVNESCICFLFIYKAVWGLFVGYSRSAVECVCAMWVGYLFRGIGQ